MMMKMSQCTEGNLLCRLVLFSIQFIHGLDLGEKESDDEEEVEDIPINVNNFALNLLSATFSYMYLWQLQLQVIWWHFFLSFKMTGLNLKVPNPLQRRVYTFRFLINNVRVLKFQFVTSEDNLLKKYEI